MEEELTNLAKENEELKKKVSELETKASNAAHELSQGKMDRLHPSDELRSLYHMANFIVTSVEIELDSRRGERVNLRQ